MKGSFEITIGFFLPNKSVFFDGLHSPSSHCVLCAGGTMLGVLGVKITKNICDESASHRKGVVKIDPRNSIPSWWWCFTSPFTESTRWLSILALLLTAPHHPPPRADAELFSLRFWSQADSASFLWKDEMSACQKAKVPRTAITEIWRAPKFKSNVMLVHWA